MCPTCLTTLALIATGSTSVGGLTALAINKVRRLTGTTTPAVPGHAALPGRTDTDMSRDADIMKRLSGGPSRDASLDVVESGEDDIFPDPVSASLVQEWRSGAAKALEIRLVAENLKL